MDEKEASDNSSKTPSPRRLVELAKIKRHIKRTRKEQIGGQMGLGFELPFDDARRIARAQNLRVQGNYLLWLASGDAPAEMPASPDLAYVSEWHDWADFLRVPKIIVPKKRGRQSKKAVAEKPPKPRGPRKYVRREGWINPRTDPRLDTRPLVELTRYDLVDGEWHCGRQYDRVPPQWSKNLCRVLAKRVMPQEATFFAVRWATDGTLYYAFRRGDGLREWLGIDYEGGNEVSQTTFRVVSYSPNEYDASGFAPEGEGGDGLTKKRARRARAGGVIGILEGGRAYRKNPDNPRWKPKP